MARLIAMFLTLLFAACAQKPDTLEREFEKMLTGVTLVGNFTLGDGKTLREEKYTIEKVSKIGGDMWMFQTRIQYGKRDVSLPLPLPVKWAGDTAMVTLTDMNLPGLGTYTARVLFYRDQYAGTWSAKDHGGHLFGRIVRAGAGAPPTPPK
ncbi:MAG: hypothetical protein ACRD96_14215 [Bryobacteraceae bacterium]